MFLKEINEASGYSDGFDSETQKVKPIRKKVTYLKQETTETKKVQIVEENTENGEQNPSRKHETRNKTQNLLLTAQNYFPDKLEGFGPSPTFGGQKMNNSD